MKKSWKKAFFCPKEMATRRGTRRSRTEAGFVDRLDVEDLITELYNVGIDPYDILAKGYERQAMERRLASLPSYRLFVLLNGRSSWMLDEGIPNPQEPFGSVHIEASNITLQDLASAGFGHGRVRFGLSRREDQDPLSVVIANQQGENLFAELVQMDELANESLKTDVHGGHHNGLIDPQ